MDLWKIKFDGFSGPSYCLNTRREVQNYPNMGVLREANIEESLAREQGHHRGQQTLEHSGLVIRFHKPKMIPSAMT